MSGKPRIRGLRIRAEQILPALAAERVARLSNTGEQLYEEASKTIREAREAT